MINRGFAVPAIVIISFNLQLDFDVCCLLCYPLIKGIILDSSFKSI